MDKKQKSRTLIGIFLLALLLAAWAPASANSVKRGQSSSSITSLTSLPLLLSNYASKEIESVQTSSTISQTQSSEAPGEELVWNPPGEAVVPILLYHHVMDHKAGSRYVISPAQFALQMQNLSAWGYQTISLSLLVEALENGADLPPHPVILTFDDGYMDIYENAFPIMSAYGFTGVSYVISGQTQIGGYMHAAQLQELVSAGWEIGSHTRSHADLRKDGVNLTAEITDSRAELEDLLGSKVLTFSFPYGVTTPYATSLVREAGYQSAVGLGGFSRHLLKTRYYLSRIEVQGGVDLVDFASLLPWSGTVISPRIVDRFDP